MRIIWQRDRDRDSGLGKLRGPGNDAPDATAVAANLLKPTVDDHLDRRLSAQALQVLVHPFFLGVVDGSDEHQAQPLLVLG